MEKLKGFLLFLVLFSLILGCGKTYIVQIHQGMQPKDQAESKVREFKLEPAEPASLTVREGSNVVYIYVFAEVPQVTTVSPSTSIVPVP